MREARARKRGWTQRRESSAEAGSARREPTTAGGARFAALTGVYVAVVLSAQIGALKIVDLPFTHLQAPGGVYSIGLALALVQAAHHTAPSRREGALNAQLMIACGFVGSGILAAYIAIVGANAAAFPGQPFDAALGQTWRIVLASLAAFVVSETVDNLVGAPLRGRVADGLRVGASSLASAPLDSLVFLTAAFGGSGLHFFLGQFVGKIASALLLGFPLVLLVRRHVRVSEPAPALG